MFDDSFSLWVGGDVKVSAMFCFLNKLEWLPFWLSEYNQIGLALGSSTMGERRQRSSVDMSKPALPIPFAYLQ